MQSKLHEQSQPLSRQDPIWRLTQGYSFTPVRDRSPMFTQIVFGQVANGGGRQ